MSPSCKWAGRKHTLNASVIHNKTWGEKANIRFQDNLKETEHKLIAAYRDLVAYPNNTLWSGS